MFVVAISKTVGYMVETSNRRGNWMPKSKKANRASIKTPFVCDHSGRNALRYVAGAGKTGDPLKKLSALGQAHLISSIQTLLGHDEYLIEHMFSHKGSLLRRPAKNLIHEAGKFSQVDQTLLRCGLDFWNQRGAARLADMLSSFTHKEWQQFVMAICYLEEITADVHEALEQELTAGS